MDTAAASDPYSTAVLINKQFALPDDYEPKDLVYPDVRFTFKEKIEKRMMRKEAAEALKELFAGAEKDGIYLAGVSAYRSHKTQTALFNRYVEKDGEEKAKTYSAVPGHSEHETGLAIDVPAATANARRKAASAIRRRRPGWPIMQRNTALLSAIRKAKRTLPGINTSHGTSAMSVKRLRRTSPNAALRWKSTMMPCRYPASNNEYTRINVKTKGRLSASFSHV
ncbi:hypothetical protein HMSSN036_94950 [Paenibacillus macerans]|nr:hypothetical protein HMSSN036_94950 [Paenibacillus macerans]